MRAGGGGLFYAANVCDTHGNKFTAKSSRPFRGFREVGRQDRPFIFRELRRISNYFSKPGSKLSSLNSSHKTVKLTFSSN